MEWRKDHDEKLALKMLASSITYNFWQDTYDQKPVSERRYDGETSLSHFVNDLKTESITRNAWEGILCISSTTSNIINNLLESSGAITEKDMAEVRKMRTPAEYNTSKNMHIALWRSVSSPSKKALVRLQSKIYDINIYFLFYIMQHCARTAP